MLTAPKRRFTRNYDLFIYDDLNIYSIIKIIVNRLDYDRIKKCIKDAKQFKSISKKESENLLQELESAEILEPEAIPSNVVTMNSVVKMSFVNTRKQIQFQIVYPNQANIRENKISILSPIATALIGYKVGDEIEWIIPAGLTKIVSMK